MQRDFNTMSGSTSMPVNVEPVTMDFNNYLEAIKLVVYGTGLDPKSATLMESTCKVFSEMSTAPELPTEYWNGQVCNKFNSSLTNEQFQVNFKWKNLFSKCMNDLNHLNKAKKEMVEKTESYLLTKELPGFAGKSMNLFNIIQKHSIPLSQTASQNKKGMMDAIILYCLEIINSTDKSIDKKEVYELLRNFKNKLSQADANPIAQYCLGVCYQSGYGTKINPDKALIYLELSADQGNKEAQYLLANIYYSKRNFKEAFELYKKSADQGHLSALDNLGFLHQKGLGTSINIDEAINCYKLSADQGYALALSNLGFVYLNLLDDKTLSFDNYKLAANLGNADAQHTLSTFYRNGTGTKINPREAFKYCKLSADQQKHHSQFELGLCYKQGYGVVINLNEAFKYFQLAALSGNSQALNELGLCYLNGSGTEVNLNEATKCLKKVANKIIPDSNSVNAQLFLSKCYKLKGNLAEFITNLDAACSNGLVDAKNELDAYLNSYKFLADKGDSEAQFMMSLILSGRVHRNIPEAFRYAQASASKGNANGQNMVGRIQHYEFKQPIEAFKYFKLSAEQGNADSQRYLGSCHEYGIGTPIDLSGAFNAYKLSADQGNEWGQKSVASMYQNGKGIPQDFGLAFNYFRLAADQGNVEAIANLAFMHYQGKGTPVNFLAGFDLLKTAADQGNTVAQVNLGLYFESGINMAVDYAQAFYYYKLAADKGDATGQCYLGSLYQEGKGTPINMEMAFKYYKLSADQGDAKAFDRLGYFYKNNLQHQFLKKS